MRAIVLTDHGGPEVLRVSEIDAPVPGPDDVLVDVHHTALNRADVLQRMGFYPDPRRDRPDAPPEIPGLEYAGVVAAVGSRVTDRRVGDQVIGIEAGGAYAEQLVTHARMAMPIPDGLALADAAAVPEVFLTAWDALVVQGGLTSGRWALVHAGASGVGTAAIQIAAAIGARIAVTCSAGKADACRQLGADLVLERSPADWLGALTGALAERGRPTASTSCSTSSAATRSIATSRAVRPQGRIVQVGIMGGGRTEVDLGLLLTKRIHWIGTVLRVPAARGEDRHQPPLRRRGAAAVHRRRAAARHRPPLPARSRSADAHRVMEADANVGKLLLDVIPS